MVFAAVADEVAVVLMVAELRRVDGGRAAAAGGAGGRGEN